MGKENEWLVTYAKEKLANNHYDYFIFGHRHLSLDLDLGGGSRYINTGDWFKSNSYAVFDGKKLSLKYFEKE